MGQLTTGARGPMARQLGESQGPCGMWECGPYGDGGHEVQFSEYGDIGIVFNGQLRGQVARVPMSPDYSKIGQPCISIKKIMIRY